MRLCNLTLDTITKLLRWKEMKVKEGPKSDCIVLPYGDKLLKIRSASKGVNHDSSNWDDEIV